MGSFILAPVLHKTNPAKDAPDLGGSSRRGTVFKRDHFWLSVLAKSNRGPHVEVAMSNQNKTGSNGHAGSNGASPGVAGGGGGAGTNQSSPLTGNATHTSNPNYQTGRAGDPGGS